MELFSWGRKKSCYVLIFFMLQADILPNIHFTSIRKWLIYSHVCENSSIQENVQQSEEEEEEKEL